MRLTADFTYDRLQGPARGNTRGIRRDKTAAVGKADRIWAGELKAIFIYFDNDQAGYAAANALTLKEMATGREAASR